jgi:hypothetical protein
MMMHFDIYKCMPKRCRLAMALSKPMYILYAQEDGTIRTFKRIKGGGGGTACNQFLKVPPLSRACIFKKIFIFSGILHPSFASEILPWEYQNAHRPLLVLEWGVGLVQMGVCSRIDSYIYWFLGNLITCCYTCDSWISPPGRVIVRVVFIYT